MENVSGDSDHGLGAEEPGRFTVLFQERDQSVQLAHL